MRKGNFRCPWFPRIHFRWSSLNLSLLDLNKLYILRSVRCLSPSHEIAPAAAAVTLAIMSEALDVRSCRPAADGTVAAGLMRWLVEPGIPVVLGTARPAP